MQDSGGLRVYKRRLPAAAHPEIPLPWVGGEVALAERGDLDIVAALDEGEQLKEEGRVALHFQCDRAVVFVFHPAGQAEALGGVPCAVAVLFNFIRDFYYILLSNEYSTVCIYVCRLSKTVAKCICT